MTSPVSPNTMINSVQADHHDAPSNTEPRSFRDSIRFRNGSLPLKKRRLHDAIPLWELQVNHNKVQTNLASSTCDAPTSENPVYTTCSDVREGKTSSGYCNEKISFLALVAAAATAGHAAAATEAPLPVNHISTNTLLPSPQESAPQQQQDEQSNSSITPSSKRSSSSTSSSSSSTTSLPTEAIPTSHYQPLINNNSSNKSEKEATLRPSGRIHHPPLSSPLPNGCHGRTSRNNSYCRRQPCYNGSKYCKLHYQHYVIAGIRPADENVEPAAVCVPVDSGVAPSTAVAAPTSSSAPRVVLVNQYHHGQSQLQQQQQQPLQQDKRFTGCDDEVRCEATTTRGRACAYVAVQGTKYCYLHADYDTNPPPRRGGGVAGAQSTTGGKPKLSSVTGGASHKRVSIVGNNRVAASPEMVDVAPVFDKTMFPSTSPPSVTSEESYAPSVSQQQVAMEESAEYLANGGRPAEEGAFPLLSTISPDQWYGRKVCIATGPLAGRIGIVEKWGNGWVGVRVFIGSDGRSDPHLHNRRALELYLLADQDDETMAVATTMPVSHSSEDMNRDNAVLRRCVSREADTTEARELREESHNYKEGDEDVAYSVKEAERSQNATPCFQNEVECNGSQEAKYDNETLEETQQRGTMIPESPMTPANGMSAVDFSMSNFHFIPRTEEASNMDDKDRFTSSVSFESAMVPAVTPRPISPRKMRVDEDLPLVQSLMLAQEGLKRKSSLDLLFGTAALERSRRTVHKPERYEDKAMLVRKRNKEGEPECDSSGHSATL